MRRGCWIRSMAFQVQHPIHIQSYLPVRNSQAGLKQPPPPQWFFSEIVLFLNIYSLVHFHAQWGQRGLPPTGFLFLADDRDVFFYFHIQLSTALSKGHFFVGVFLQSEQFHFKGKNKRVINTHSEEGSWDAASISCVQPSSLDCSSPKVGPHSKALESSPRKGSDICGGGRTKTEKWRSWVLEWEDKERQLTNSP